MAVRTISTRFAVEGEKEYKSAVEAINRELKTLGSALQLATSEFRNNANSLGALKAKSESLGSIYGTQEKKVEALANALKNAQSAVDKFAAKQDEIKAALSANAEAMAKMDKSAEGAATELDRLQKEHDDLQRSLTANQNNIDAAGRSVANWEVKLNGAKVELNKLGDELSETNKYLAEAESSADGLATSIDEYGNNVKEAGADTKEFGNTSQQSITALAGVLVSSGLMQGFEKITDAIKGCMSASLEFESAITGVFKTVNGTDAQLNKITGGIKELALRLPITTTELAAIAEAAGQLGIETDNILSFTETIANLANTTNLTAEQAASDLSKFMNITGTQQSEIERLGSTIVALGNNFATTESDIVSMAMRLSSAGTQIGLSEAQILGFSAALSSLGLEAEAGGTAFSTAVKEMQIAVETSSDNLAGFAEIAGMTAEAFQKLWTEDSQAAVTAFINGLAGVEGSSKSTIQMLDEIGFSGIRVSDAWTRLSSNTDLVTEAVSLANSAWSDNTALLKEAEMRYETTESKIQIFKNAITGLQVAVGDQLSPVLEKATKFGTAMAEWLTEYITKTPEVVQGLTALASALGAMTAGAVAITAISAAWKIMSAAISPTSLVVLGVVALAAAVTALVATYEDLDADTRAFVDEIERMATASEDARIAYADMAEGIEKEKLGTSELVSELESLLAVEEKSAAQKAIILGVVDELNASVPGLGISYDAVTDSINMSVESMREFAEASYNQAKIEAMKDRLTELMTLNIDFEVQMAEGQSKIAAAQAEYNVALAEYSKVQSEMRDTGDYNRNISEQAAALAEAESAVNGLVEGQNELLSQYTQNNSELEALTDNYNALVETMEPVPSATNELTETFKNANGDTVAYSEEIAKLNEQLAGMTTELEAAETAYREEYKAAFDAISGQLDLFEELSTTVTTTTDAMMNAWETQINYFTVYADNLNRAAEYMFNENLMRKLADGSDSSVQALGAIITELEAVEKQYGIHSAEAEAFVTEINLKYDRVQQAIGGVVDAQEEWTLESKDNMDQLSEGTQALQEDIQDMQTEFQRAVEEAKKVPVELGKQGPYAVAGSEAGAAFKRSLMAEFESIGPQLGIGFLKGVSGGKAGEKLVDDIAKGVKDAAEIKSPSKLFMRLGAEVSKGFALGISQQIAEVEAASRKLVEAVDIETSKLAVRIPASKINAQLRATSQTSIMQTIQQKSYNNNPVVNFNQPMRSPYEIARQLRRELGALML